MNQADLGGSFVRTLFAYEQNMNKKPPKTAKNYQKLRLIRIYSEKLVPKTPNKSKSQKNYSEILVMGCVCVCDKGSD